MTIGLEAVDMINGEEKRREKFKELRGQGAGMMIYLCVHRFKNEGRSSTG